MTVLYIDTDSALIDLAAKLAGSEWLAIDTEFVREKTYYPILCLIQIANDDLIACVDPIAIGDLEPLRALFFDSAITKVLHSARQDMETFLIEWNALPAPIFDTQIAATLLGQGEQIGYARLVEAMLGVELDKSQTRTDWSRRPLSEAQLEYAADDVRYLRDIYHNQLEALKRKNRLEWLEKDFTELSDPDVYDINPDDTWKRVKGYQKLRGVRLAVLQKLAAWRELQAREQNLPRRWVLADDTLLDLAQSMPKDQDELLQMRNFTDKQRERLGNRLTDIVTEASGIPQTEWPVIPPRRTAGPEESALLDAMTALVELASADHDVSAQTLASRKDLRALIDNDPNAALRHGWKAALIGDKLRAFLQGEIGLDCTDGHLTIREKPATD